MKTEYMDQIEAILKKAKEDGYNNGIAEGFAVAQRIIGWWSSNDHLKEPHSHETLMKWTNEALSELQSKLKTNEKPKVF